MNQPRLECSLPLVTHPWASDQKRKIAGAHAPGMPGTFSPQPGVSDRDMHHGTCVTHVPWCMPGSLTSSFLWSRRRGKFLNDVMQDTPVDIKQIILKYSKQISIWHCYICHGINVRKHGISYKITSLQHVRHAAHITPTSIIYCFLNDWIQIVFEIQNGFSVRFAIFCETGITQNTLN